MAQGKIRIRLKGYDHQQLDRSAQQIVDTAQRSGATITGPVPLPTEKNVYCVIRSPFKDKDSREHFEVQDAQAPDRHPQPDAEDDRPAHAARSPGRNRHRDQALDGQRDILGREARHDPDLRSGDRRGHGRHGDRGRPVPRRAGQDGRHRRLRRRAARLRRGSRPEADAARARAPEALRRRRRTGRSSSSAAASTAPSRARRSRSRCSSPATRSRSPGSGSARASRARSSATTSRAARAATARTTSAPPARSAPRPRPRACSRASSWPGRMGGKRVTQLGLTVHSIDAEQNLLLVKGSIPGPKNGLVEVRG